MNLITDEGKALKEIIEKQTEIAVDELKSMCGLSGKKFDTAMKELRELDLIIAEKVGDKFMVKNKE